MQAVTTKGWLTLSDGDLEFWTVEPDLDRGIYFVGDDQPRPTEFFGVTPPDGMTDPSKRRAMMTLAIE